MTVNCSCVHLAGAHTSNTGTTDSADDLEAGDGAKAPPTQMCLVVHPDNAFACAARLSMEHQLITSPSLASAWSAKLSRGPSTKLEGEALLIISFSLEPHHNLKHLTRRLTR